MSSGLGSSCGACKFLRRRCADGCIFAPYFSYDLGAIHFAAVHKVFGASNVSKLLSHLPVHRRNEAAITVSFEAQARMRDPIYGCVSHILALQQQVTSLQEEIESLTVQLANTCSEGADPSSQAMDGQLKSFQLDTRGNDWISSASSNTNARNFNDFQGFSPEENLQGLSPMRREAMYQLERSLFSDFGDDSTPWEDLLVNTMEDVMY